MAVGEILQQGLPKRVMGFKFGALKGDVAEAGFESFLFGEFEDGPGIGFRAQKLTRNPDEVRIVGVLGEEQGRDKFCIGDLACSGVLNGRTGSAVVGAASVDCQLDEMVG